MIDTPLNLNALQEQVDDVAARAGGDPSLATRLHANPAAALRDEGVAIPPGARLDVTPRDGGPPALTVQLRDA